MWRKRSTRIKRKRVARKRRVVRRTRAVRNNFLSTKRFVYALVLPGSDVTPSGVGGITYQFSDIPAYTDFTNTFDSYKLCGIRYRWVVIRSADQTGTTVGGTLGLYSRVLWAYDFNDASSPASFADIQQYNNCKEVYLTNARPVSRWYFFKPKDLTIVAGSGYTTAKTSSWLRMSETNIPHYSIKYAYDGNQASQQIRLEAYYYFQCKSIR